jgi:hypothetical protein
MKQSARQLPAPHTWPEPQLVPFATGVFTHEPFTGLHIDVLQALGGVHVTGFDPVQVPLWQA